MPQIGRVYLHYGRPVLVTGGQYESNGRISNFWDFKYIDRCTGRLSRNTYGDYDNHEDAFRLVRGAKVETKIILPKKTTRTRKEETNLRGSR